MAGVPHTNSEIIAEFRRNGGIVGGFYEGVTVLLLTTTGRKSGGRVTTPLSYQRAGDRLIVIGANVGASKQPDWYYNLLADPHVTFEVGTAVREAVASVLDGDERDRYVAAARRAWDEARQSWPELPAMPPESERRIPVVAITPR